MKLTTENTAIVLDSTSDFPEAGARFPNMRVVPLYVNFGSESFKDHVDIGSHDFYERLQAAPALPTTSQPTPQDFVSAFEELAGYDRIYAFQLSAKLSGTFQSAVIAAAEVEGDRIRVVDTETASLAVGLLALAVERRLARGTTDEEIDDLIERFKRENGVVFTVGTLEYLQKGGRIGRAQALAGTLLNVRPIMSVDDGVIHPIGKVRGRQKALAEFARVFTAATEDRSGLRTAIAHADAPEWIDVLTDMVSKARPQAEIELVENLGAVVGTHAGPGSVGFFWFQDE
jgi:DegV family protein with EDD domain